MSGRDPSQASESCASNMNSSTDGSHAAATTHAEYISSESHKPVVDGNTDNKSVTISSAASSRSVTETHL